MWRALDADCSGYLSMGEFGKFMRSGESAERGLWGSACQRQKVQNAREHVLNERKQKKVEQKRELEQRVPGDLGHRG